MAKLRWKSESDFNKFLVREYLKYGSVDKVLNSHKNDLPISYANYQRILDKWGIIKAAGSNRKLTETVEFLSKLADEKMPLESLYKKTPTRFKSSVATMHRILGYVKEGVTRRLGTALVLTSSSNSNKVLIAEDVSTPRLEFGKKYGSITLPMGFSSKKDTRRQAIARILQQEVFVNQAVSNNFPKTIIPENPKPFLFLDIADVRIEAFHLSLPQELCDKKALFSYKLKNFQFVDVDDLVKDGSKHKLREGIKEGLLIYKRYKQLLKRNLAPNAMFDKADLNLDLTSSDP